MKSRTGAFFCALAAAFMIFAGPAGAQQKPPIKLGLISPLSGPFASLGKLQEVLVKMAVEDVNAKGLINGSRLELEAGDSQLDPGQAVLLFRKFANEGFFGVVGPMTGTQWETVAPIANQINMPAVAANATKPGITVRPWSLRLTSTDDMMLPDGMKTFLKLYPKTKKVVIVADVREASSKAAAEMFEKLAKESGLQVAEVVEFSTRATDMSPVAIKVKSHNPDAVLSTAFLAQALLLAKEFTAQGVKVPVLNAAFIWSSPFITMVGENGRNWHTIGFSTNDGGAPGRSDLELHRSVVKRAQQRADPSLGTPLNVANFEVGYDVVLLYADIMRRNGIDGSTDPKKAREIIKNEFMKMKSFKGVYDYTIRDTGDSYLPFTILVPDIDRKVWKFPNQQ
jgi:branched-chain amino acid transport system substrate-binding protein